MVAFPFMAGSLAPSVPERKPLIFHIEARASARCR
jgi:hypothetical protein